jgi:hypothetical protein
MENAAGSREGCPTRVSGRHTAILLMACIRRSCWGLLWPRFLWSTARTPALRACARAKWLMCNLHALFTKRKESMSYVRML